MNATEAKQQGLSLSLKALRNKLEWLMPILILGAVAVGYMADIGGTENAAHMDNRIHTDVSAVVGTAADTLSKAELTRMYLENTVQNSKAGYEMVWATSCSSANVRVAGVDAATMETLNPTIAKLDTQYGKADYKSIDRIYGQNAYLVCSLFKVELNETQSHALKGLRGEDKSFSCLTPIRRACSVVPM